MNKYQHIIGRAQYIVFLAFLALLPFPQVLLRYACVLWFLLWFLEGRWLSRVHLNLQPSRYRLAIPFLLFGLWFGYKLLSGLWAGNTEAWSAQIERYLHGKCIKNKRRIFSQDTHPPCVVFYEQSHTRVLSRLVQFWCWC